MGGLAVTVCGCLGRMGRLLCLQVDQAEDLNLVGALEHPGHPSVGKNIADVIPDLSSGPKVIADPQQAMSEAEVVIDFTTPEATLNHLETAVRAKKAIVIGTTGFEPSQRRRLEELAAKTRTVLAANMSVGVNLLLAILPEVAKALGDDYDIEISEIHHRFKADAPSGTALALGRVIAEALGRDLEKDGVFGRQGRPGPRGSREIGVMAFRAGDVVGEHTVVFGGLGERIELTHRAHSREVFARGAVRAARWVVSQPVGLYSMTDVLGLRKK